MHLILRAVLAVAILGTAATTRAEVTVERREGTIVLENRFLRATLGETGGKLVSLYDKATDREWAFSPVVSGGGFAGDRILENPDWQDLMSARYELEVVSATPEQAVVRARARAASGPGKGMDFEHLYTLRAGECRLKLRWQIFANENWAEFSPWSKHVILLPPAQADKASTAVSCQTGRGLYREYPVRPRHDQAMIFNLKEPWVGTVSSTSKAGLCIVAEERWLSHVYCWYGNERLFTIEPIFKPHAFAPGGSWGADLWFIPTRGVGRFHLATRDYVAGLAPEGLEFFPAVPLPQTAVGAAPGAADPVPGAAADLAAGEPRLFPCAAPAELGDLRVVVATGDRETRHAVRASPGDVLSEFDASIGELKTDVAPSDSALATYLKDTLYLSPDLPVAVHFGMAANFKEPGRKVELVLEIPPGVRVAGAKTEPVAGEVERDGVTYRTLRFAVNPLQTYYNVCEMFMTVDLPPGGRTEMTYRMAWEGGEQPARRLPIESVRIEPCQRIPKRLVAGLGFYGLDVLARWPGIHDALRHVGLNVISLNDHDDSKVPEMRAEILKARERGLYTAANYSPTCRPLPPDAPDEAKAHAMDGATSKFLCPSYRGPVLEAELDRATSYAAAGAAIVYWDAESWRGREFCFCPRCLEQFEAYRAEHRPDLAQLDPRQFEEDPGKHPEYHALWESFRISLGTALFKRYRDEYARRLEESGVTGTGPEKMLIGSYDVNPGKIYHQFQRFDELYAAGALNLCMPSFYYGGDAKRIGEGVRAVRRAVGNSRIIPWLCGGDDTLRDCVGIEQKYVLLELFLNGSMGFTTWPYNGWDAQDLKYVSQVMNLVVPIEDLLMDGEVMAGLGTSDEQVRAVGLVRGGEAAILVSGYYHADLPAVTLKLTSPAAAKLFDLATGEELATVKAGENTVALPAYPEQARLLYLGEQAPAISYPCPPEAPTPTTASP
jgi:hypothetical protein